MNICCLNDRKLLKAVALLAGIYLLGISAILRANYYYIDDMGRALLGYKQFDFFGRYIPQYFTTVLHADSYLTDISPLPQLIAVVILAMAAVTVLYLVTGRKEFTAIEYVSTIPLCLSPYFLECLSYKYDAPYMALSILASVAPVLYYKRSNLIYFVSVFVGMLAVCMSYQAASGIFPMFVVLMAFLQWMDNVEWKVIVRFVLISIGGYLAGMLFFMLFIMKPKDSYVSNSLPSAVNFLPLTVAHFKQYYKHVVKDFKMEWLAMIALLCFGFVWASVRNTKRNKWVTAFLSGLTILAFLALAFGVYPFLSKPLYDPRAMYGFGAFICFTAMPVVTRKHSVCFKVVCAMLCWCFFVFGFTYGNSLHAQKMYTDYRIAAVIHDLDELDILDEVNAKVYQFEGDIGFAPEIAHMPQDYEILRRLIPETFGDSSSYWRSFRFYTYFGLKNAIWDDDIDLLEYDLALKKDSIYHTIYANDESVLIVMKPF